MSSMGAGGTHRIGAYASFDGLIDLHYLFFPSVRVPHRLHQVVVDHLAASRFGETGHHAGLHFDNSPFAALDDAGSELSQYIAERKDLGLVGPDDRNIDTLGIALSLV